MTDLKFPELRAYVENHTVLPQFDAVETRARRHKRKRKIVTTVSTLACLVLVLPAIAFGASVMSQFYDPSGVTQQGLGGPADDGDGLPVAVPTATPPAARITTATLVTVAGVDPSHLFDLVDLCISGKCALQFGTFLNPNGQHVIRAMLWSHAVAEPVSDAQIIVTSPTNVQVSAVIGNATSPVAQNITVTTGLTLGSAPQPCQLATNDVLRVVRPGQGITALPTQPVLSYPDLIGTSHGWWVAGENTAGEFSVSVSRDEGATWHTRSLGVIDTSNVTGLTTSNGNDVYLLVQTSGQIQLYYSDNGGDTWTLRPSFAGDAVATRMGLYENRHNQLIIWYYNDVSGATTFYLSADKGAHVVAAGGIGPRDADGPVVSAAGTLFALGVNSAFSADGGTVWTSVYGPYDPAALESTS